MKRDVAMPVNCVLLKGESENLQNGSAQPQTQTPVGTAQKTPALTVKQPAEMKIANHTPEVDHLGPTFETPPPARHSTHQHFESDYMR